MGGNKKPPALGLIGRVAVLEMTGFSAATLYRLIRRDEFPRPADYPSKTRWWRKSEVIEWIKLRT